jgi:glutathione S-transferase
MPLVNHHALLWLRESHMSESLNLYGVPFSQPVRAVAWLLLNKKMPFQMVMTNPGSKGSTGSRNPDFLARNPAGTIPTIEEPDSGFVLAEAHAIMTYLCRKHGWSDLYPTDPQQAAKVDWYLHYHHRNVRDGSVGFIAPNVRKDLNFPELLKQTYQGTFSNAVQTLENGWLAGSKFLAGDHFTIADIAAYVEVGQLRSEFTNLFDFSPYPNVLRWLDDVAAQDGHDDVHVALTVMGDISQDSPSMETIINANKMGFARLQECVAALG